jgi:hypothetical protein
VVEPEEASMTEYAWPATLRPSRLSFYLQHNTLRFVSPVTRATQVLRREGARWVAEATFEPLGRVQAGVMDGKSCIPLTLRLPNR